MKTQRVSISTCQLQKKYGDRRAIEIAAEIGANGIDFDLLAYDSTKTDNLYTKGDEAVRAYFSDLRAYAESMGILIVQTHGRIRGFQLDTMTDDALVESARLDCIATRALGAKYCVIHTFSNNAAGENAPKELMYRVNREMYCRLLPFADAEGIKIATETFGATCNRGCAEFFGDITHFLNGYEDIIRHSEHAASLCVCMDVGHTNSATQLPDNPPVADVIRRLGSRIEVLHLHDNNAISDQHKLPMTGTVNWKDVFDALDEIGYDGWYNLECRLDLFGKNFEVETAAFAVRILRHLLAIRYERSSN